MSRRVARSLRMSGSGLEALPYVWVWSRVSLGCPGVDESPSWMSEVVARHSRRMSGIGQVDLPDIRE